jgi:hypothetical protein
VVVVGRHGDSRLAGVGKRLQAAVQTGLGDQTKWLVYELMGIYRQTVLV